MAQVHFNLGISETSMASSRNSSRNGTRDNSPDISERAEGFRSSLARVGSSISNRGGLDSRTHPSDNLANREYMRLNDLFYTQSIFVDDDLQFTIHGRITSPQYSLINSILKVCTGGLWFLLCAWFEFLQVSLTTTPIQLNHATHLLIKNQWGECEVVDVEIGDFDGYLYDAFPKSTLQNEHIDKLRFFTYRYFRFIFNPTTGFFEPNYKWSDSNWQNVPDLLNGKFILSSKEIRQRKVLFGKNSVEIKEKQTFQLLMDECLHPFFVFQIISIILWSLDTYYWYAGCILVITIFSTVITLFETKRNIARLRSLTVFISNVKVYRDYGWKYISSDSLMPGDIFEIEGDYLPADAVCLEGDCIINECMLTGESLPVSKTPIPDADLKMLEFEDEEPASSQRLSKFFLFCGTRIVRARSLLTQTRGICRGGAIAMVVRTGFNTAKGNLIRQMLFPRPNRFKFYEDSFKFIG